MKKLQNLGRELSKLEQMKIKGGDVEVEGLDAGTCIADGKRCSLFKDCCGYCKGTGLCGPV